MEDYESADLTSMMLNENISVETSFLIIFPDCYPKLVWNIIGIFFILYQGMTVPYRICFNSAASGFLGYLEMIQDFYFIMDILITLNTGYYEKGCLIMTRKQIIIEYLKIWFWIDIAASFPYSLVVSPAVYFSFEDDSKVVSNGPSVLRILKFIRIMRAFRLLRVLKLKRFLVQIEEFIMSDTFNISITFLKLLLLILLIAHWGACIWFFIGIGELVDNNNSWLIVAQIVDAPKYDQYIASLYFYIITMTTVGYGDITPQTYIEKIYVMFSMLMACGVFAYVIGSIGTVLSSRFDAETTFKTKMMHVNQYLLYKNINKSLRLKIRRYLEYVLDNKKEQKIDEAEVLNMLSKNLKDEIILHLNGQLIRNLKLIEKYEELCVLLSNIMKEELINPNEIIFKTGDESNTLYFLTRGNIFICDLESKILYKELNQETYFGEIGFFTKCPRIATAESVNFVRLNSISKILFIHSIKMYKFQDPQKFNLFNQDLKEYRKNIKLKMLSKINSSCYLCLETNHYAPQCEKLNKIGELYKLKYKDRKYKTDNEINQIYKILSERKIQDINLSKSDFLSADDEVDSSIEKINKYEEAQNLRDKVNKIRILNDNTILEQDDDKSSFSDSNSSSFKNRSRRILSDDFSSGEKEGDENNINKDVLVLKQNKLYQLNY